MIGLPIIWRLRSLAFAALAFAALAFAALALAVFDAIECPPSETGKIIFEDLFSSVFLQLKISPLWNLKFNNLSTFQSLKSRISMEKILPI